MTSLNAPTPLNVDHLITMIYDIQTSLKMLADQLARDRNPDYSNQTLWGIAAIHQTLRDLTPSLTRH